MKLERWLDGVQKGGQKGIQKGVQKGGPEGRVHVLSTPVYWLILLFFGYYQIVSYPSFTVEITKKTVSSRHLFGCIVIFKVSV